MSDNILNWSYDDSDILDWELPDVFETKPKLTSRLLINKLSVKDMIAEVEQLKADGRDPTTDKFKPLRQTEPASSDFYYHLGFYNKDPQRYNAMILLELPLYHMRANAYYIDTPLGEGFVSKSDTAGYWVELGITNKQGAYEHHIWNTKTKEFQVQP